MDTAHSPDLLALQGRFPLVVTPGDFDGDASLEGLICNAPSVVDAELGETAGILFRGFDVLGEAPFQ